MSLAHREFRSVCVLPGFLPLCPHSCASQQLDPGAIRGTWPRRGHLSAARGFCGSSYQRVVA